MHSRITSIFLSFAILLQSLNASFAPAASGVLSTRPVAEVSSNTQELVQASRKADIRIFVLDNGGVLQKSDLIRGSPDQQNAIQAATDALTPLAQNDRNVVAINSARSSPLYTKDFYPGVPNLYVAGNMGSHAVFHKDPNTDPAEIEELQYLHDKLKNIHDEVKVEKSNQGWKSEIQYRPGSIIIHHDKDEAEEKEKFTAAIKKLLLNENYKDYRLTEPFPNNSKKLFYSISHEDANKGTFTQWLINDTRRKHPNAKIFALSIGDQKTDEPMHQVMKSNNFNSIIVSTDENTKTAATHKLKDVNEVLALLEKLAKPAPQQG